ncbi:MAG: Mur ligase domain-containing protein, partial [bacterium]
MSRVMVIETFEQVKRVHFVGIGGAGMSALAHLVMRRGIQVSGSDILESEITQRLAGEGAEVSIGHSAELIEGADWLIISDAISPKNPELVAAKEKGLSIWRRSELLGWVTKQYQSIAIAGTHGKTTTTAILGQMLIEAKTDPTILVGGDIPGFSGNARVGGGKVLVTEACEAYNGFIDLWPHIGVITNIEADHLDFHGTEEQLRRNFMAYARLLPTDGHLILHQDDPATKEMATSVNCNIHTFSLNG